MKTAKTACPPPVAKAIDTLRAELSAYYGCDFAFTVAGKGHTLSACNLVAGDVRPVPFDAERQAEERETEIAREHDRDN